MVFHSILYEKREDAPGEEVRTAPACFADLLLDQVIDAVTDGKQDYNLKPFFYAPLTTIRAIQYRQEIMRELEDETLLGCINSFATKMAAVRRYLLLVSRLDYPNHKKGWFLDAAHAYCEAVTELQHCLSAADLSSRGFRSFRDYLTSYARTDEFVQLTREAMELKAELAAVRYSVIIDGLTVRVRKCEAESDYSLEVDKTFGKFKEAAGKDYRTNVYKHSGMDHVEAQILDFVARLFPEVFTKLDDFCTRHTSFLEPALQAFDREIHFYVAYLEYIAGFRGIGLRFCYPEISAQSKDIHDYDGFDLALAYKRKDEHAPVVCNDFYLRGPERIFVVSGPNQGGKTTFGRTFGQLHHLARLGCPVPGREARLYLCDQIFTHFEKQENIENLRGKLEDDLFRIHEILGAATPRSIVIMNEILTSTTLEDAVTLSKKILQRIIELDSLCVFVTFIDELASLSEKTVSMVSTVVPDNPAIRTFKIVRKPADGLAYAISIAEKYRLTYDQILERTTP